MVNEKGRKASLSTNLGQSPTVKARKKKAFNQIYGDKLLRHSQEKHAIKEKKSIIG